MARGEDTGNHPGRQVGRVTGPGVQGHSVSPLLGNFERRLMEAQGTAPAAESFEGHHRVAGQVALARSQQGTRLDDRYKTLGNFTSKFGRTEERAISRNTYQNANLRRSITSDPISRRKTMRQKTGGELAGY